MFANFKIISLFLAVYLIVGGTYAFATQDEAATSPAVYKTDKVFGYDVTGIIFDVNDSDPTVVDTITFHVTPSNGSTKATHVEIQTTPDGVWTECSLVDDIAPAAVATCRFGNLPADDVTELNIVAK